MRRPRLHLICTAHLDPVWQWRWEEGAAEAIATFRNAAALLRKNKKFIFNHNEAVLYRWVERHDPVLFREIQRLVREGRWSVGGGWYLQPDLNLPGLESLLRQITEGRRYFWEKFKARPVVAYNFDSFGHGGGLPQILRRAGYEMYIHMRPQEEELHLPSDLYLWRGVEGSEILAYRIAVGLYHTERDNIEERLREGTKLALKFNRDVPVFWGLGNHGGGATREDLEKIEAFAARDSRVAVIHSTPDKLYRDLRGAGQKAPVVEGDLQRVFTGCYTSLARVKRKAEESLGALVQAEALAATSWWLTGQEYPRQELEDAWRDHLFNDFHDILTGSCTEPAERDALDLYGKALDSARRVRLRGAAALNGRVSLPEAVPLPVSVFNTNPALTRVPVEVECMADYRPFWKGEWHLEVFDLAGRRIPSQEEQPESLLPFHNWRRRLCFMADLAGVGAAHFAVRAERGPKTMEGKAGNKPEIKYRIDRNRGLITLLEAGDGRSLLAGPLLEPLVIRDEGDSWGTRCGSYRDLAGRFSLEKGSVRTIDKGPVRTIMESVFAYGKSRLVFHTVAYAFWPALEFRLRVHWNEERAMLKLAVPTAFRSGNLISEVPGGAMERPADREEHVFGRWALIEGEIKGKRRAVAVACSGQHGLDFKAGELRISVLRSAAYCHERGFPLEKYPARKSMDQGVHDLRFLVTAGNAKAVRASVSALADWLNSPPFALAHLPLGKFVGGEEGGEKRGAEQPEEGSAEQAAQEKKRQNASGLVMGFANAARGVELLSLSPSSIRLTACKPSPDGRALIVRLHETAGKQTAAELTFKSPAISIPLEFGAYEIKTVRVERSGAFREVDLISET